MSRSAVIALCVFALSLASPLANAATRPADWADGKGPATAARLLDQCMAKVPAGPPSAAGIGCFDVALDACLNDNGGTMSQRDMNGCRYYSKQAWQARYDQQLARLDKVLQAWRDTPGDGWQKETVGRFREQERAWAGWMKADCEMRELGSVGGSIHSYAVGTCEERHIAFRTLDLTPVVEGWEGR